MALSNARLLAFEVPTVPTFNSCTKYVDSPGRIHDRTPDCHTFFLGMDAYMTLNLPFLLIFPFHLWKLRVLGHSVCIKALQYQCVCSFQRWRPIPCWDLVVVERMKGVRGCRYSNNLHCPSIWFLTFDLFHRIFCFIFYRCNVCYLPIIRESE